MPAFALAISAAFGLPKELSTGMILVGCVSGGTASNVICCLAGARVALSISMTAVSTVLGLFLTPLLTLVYAGHFVSVPLGGMLYNIALMVILPVSIGVALNRPLASRREQLQRYCPLVSMLAIVMVIAIVVSMNRTVIAEAGLTVFMAVAAHNLSGMAAGYLLARLCGCDVITARTVSIEVGMQNSGLAAALAKSCFSPAAALPGAIFSIWHNLSGSLAAAYWKQLPSADSEPADCGGVNMLNDITE
jgi:BASS family bile acid:Na+ symporter